ncbi:hypothetical protein V5799_033502 [Amblyomma americanum]|uniref:DUF4806 domain-containing protein n=1 Tax=Amblyomma americanum TaxID=6943 RepID=A0AAQ4DN49_AMBAM
MTPLEAALVCTPSVHSQAWTSPVPLARIFYSTVSVAPSVQQVQDMYAIVEFNNTREVELVPCTWLNGDKCLWPSVAADKAVRLVRRGDPPSSEFVEYAASVKGIFRTYGEGRKKLELARFTSDLSTDESTPKRRRIVRPNRWNDSDSSEPEDYPVAPRGLLECRNTPRSQKENVAALDSCLNEVTATAYVTPHAEEPANSAERLQGPGLNGDPLAGQSTSRAATADLALEREVPPSPSQQCGAHNCSRCLGYADFQRRVMSNFAIIRHTQTEILELLSGITRPESQVPENTDCVVSEPFGTVEELKAFDSGLTPERRNALIAQLQSYGTKSVPVTVRTMMAQLMKDSLAAQFSMHGRKGKERFDALQLRSVIFDSVRRTRHLQEVTHDDVDTAIKEWLRRAKERCNQKLSQHFLQ